MIKPSAEFFATLGKYVYQYIDETGKVLYTGKGTGDRCWVHTVEKGLDPMQCWITANNLQRFENKKDGHALMLESYLIAKEDPQHNSVSGHYKECFVMSNLSEFFGKFQAQKGDAFESFPDWYVENYDSLRGRLSEVKINSTTTFFKTVARNKLYMMWWYSPTEQSTKVGFEINVKDKDDTPKEIENFHAGMKQWLKKQGYSKPTQEGVEYKLHITVDSMDEVIKLVNKFFN